MRPAADLFPPQSDPGPDPAWPLGLALCGECSLVQLTHRSPAPQEPRAVESETVRRHARAVSARLVERLAPAAGSAVREFSSAHGGSWLEALSEQGLRPTDEAGAALVVDNHAIIHEEDVAAAFAERVAALRPGGALVVEFHHALAQLEQAQVDTIRHGHPVYFSLRAWSRLCAAHGLTVTDAWAEPVYGGCLVVVAEAGGGEPNPEVERIAQQESQAGLADPDRWRAMGRHARQHGEELREWLESAAARGRTVLGYGAGSKAPLLLGLAGVDADLLPATADLAPAKHGRRLPGSRIAVISPEQLVAQDPDEVLVLLWDLAPEVAGQLRDAGLTGSRYVVAGPRVHELD